jgi:hypothetical protein
MRGSEPGRAQPRANTSYCRSWAAYQSAPAAASRLSRGTIGAQQGQNWENGSRGALNGSYRGCPVTVAGRVLRAWLAGTVLIVSWPRGDRRCDLVSAAAIKFGRTMPPMAWGYWTVPVLYAASGLAARQPAWSGTTATVIPSRERRSAHAP